MPGLELASRRENDDNEQHHEAKKKFFHSLNYRIWIARTILSATIWELVEFFVQTIYRNDSVQDSGQAARASG